MSFISEVIMGIEFNEEKHEYTLDGVKIPSVTEILSPITMSGYSKINPAVLEHAAMKGTLVHEWCEMYDYGCAEDSVPSEIEPYCRAYMAFVRDYKPQWTMVEAVVYCDTMVTGNGFAGTLDRAGVIDGKECVVDIKTISSPTTKQHISVCCQTAAYSLASGIWGRRYALYLKPDGTYRLMNCEEYEQKHGFSGFDLFGKLSCIHTEISEIGGRNGR